MCHIYIYFYKLRNYINCMILEVDVSEALDSKVYVHIYDDSLYSHHPLCEYI